MNDLKLCYVCNKDNRILLNKHIEQPVVIFKKCNMEDRKNKCNEIMIDDNNHGFIVDRSGDIVLVKPAKVQSIIINEYNPGKYYRNLGNDIPQVSELRHEYGIIDLRK